jgi:hypothetical protein
LTFGLQLRDALFKLFHAIQHPALPFRQWQGRVRLSRTGLRSVRLRRRCIAILTIRKYNGGRRAGIQQSSQHQRNKTPLLSECTHSSLLYTDLRSKARSEAVLTTRKNDVSFQAPPCAKLPR